MIIFWQELREVIYLKTNNETGCGLCDATWGKYYKDIDGDNMVFCCSICADIFEEMVRRVKENTGWKSIDYVELHGNYSRGRECTARNGDDTFSYYFRTYSDGKFITFEKR
jgi:hypothetical protein